MKKSFFFKILIWVVAFLVLSSCTQLLFVPSRQLIWTPAKVQLPYTDIALPVNDNLVLHGWHLPSVGASKGRVVFLHGNGENISTHLASVYWLPAAGYDVYLFDYRGYGQSQGEVDLAGSVSDIEAMIAYVAQQTAAGEKLFVLGHSMGASMGIAALAHSPYRQRITALISVSAFSDYRVVTRDVLSQSWITWWLQWPLSFTIDNDYSPQRFIAAIAPVPVVIMHSQADEIIAPYHADILLRAATEPKMQVWLQGKHNALFNDENNRKILLHYLQSF